MSLPKINIPLPCGFIYQHCQIPDLVPRTSTNCMQPPWYNSNQMWMSWWGPRPFQLNKCKSFKNRAQFVKDDVIDHFVTRTSSEWRVIGIARQNTDIARKDDSRMAMNCQSYCCAMSHFLFCDHISSLNEACLSFVFLLFWNQEMFLSKVIFLQNILIKLQHAIKINQSWRLKVFWLNDSMLKNDMRWPNNFELIPPETEPHNVAKFLAVCIMTCSGFSSYGLVNDDSYKSKSLHWMRSKFIGSNRHCLKWEKAIFVILSHFLK